MQLFWLCKFLRNSMPKSSIIVAYTARDPCATSRHTMQCISTCVNVLLVLVSSFSDSVRLFSVLVEVLSSEL